MTNARKTDATGRPLSAVVHSVRVPAHSYVMAVFAGTFFSALAFYLEYTIAGSSLFLLTWLIVPALALTDRLKFNGKRISRSGLVSKVWAYLSGSRFWLKARDIEQIETHLSPTLRRGGRVYFRYSSQVRGNGVEFSFRSGGSDYREFARSLFSAVSEEVLDAGSIELRDYLSEPRETRLLAKNSDIPPADVLESAFRTSRAKRRKGTANTDSDPVHSSEKAFSLRQLGNQLRLSGSLLQAMESFRRAASIRPDDAWLLFDFARCIQLFAGTEGDVRLERKAAAMLRLAERRAGNDGRLLARLGECYFQLGEWGRSRTAFAKSAEAIGDHFRAVRGMAEISLRDGKLAHVVHNFSAASRSAESRAARRWSEGEAEYFSRLSNDDEYLEMELGRVNLLDTLERWRGVSFRLCLIGLPVIGLGLYFDDATTADCGWILSGGSLVLWTLLSLGSRAFTPRISPELLGED